MGHIFVIIGLIAVVWASMTFGKLVIKRAEESKGNAQEGKP